jgi:hypothetical protein
MISKKLKGPYTEAYDGLIKEVEENYIQTMHDAVLEYVIRPADDYINIYKIPVKFPP